MTSQAMPVTWNDKDLGDILRHQLAAPLIFDLGSTAGLGQDAGLASVNPGITSFGELLTHPNPPLVLLKLSKDFAKASDKSVDAPLPPEIASMLYFACVAAALVRLGERITELDDQQLKKGLRWGAKQVWVSEETHALFRQANEVLT